MTNVRLLGIALGVLLGCAACSDTMPRERGTDATVGALTGTAVGAGAGAIVGGTISGLDVGTSALVGGGAGLVVGAVGGYAYSRYSEEEILNARDSQIEENRAALNERQRAIDALRREVDSETRAIRPDKSRREYHFTGESLGNPYR